MNGIEQVIDVLEKAERIGYQVDEPEGTRYIKLSETLVKVLIKKLRSEGMGG